MATKAEQNRKQVDKNEGNSNNTMSQTIIMERKESSQTSVSGVAMVTERRPHPSIHNPCLPFGERTDQQRLPLLLSEETERPLFNGMLSTQCEDSSSKSLGKTRFDVHQQEQMLHKISSTDFKLVNLNSDDTRLVDGLLTTTLCSTEL